MANRTEKQNEQYNQSIIDALHIAQMMESKGFRVLNKFLEEKEQEFRYQDILGLKKENLDEQKGMAAFIDSLFDYFGHQKLLAEKPKVDIETGEPEILNKKKK